MAHTPTDTFTYTLTHVADMLRVPETRVLDLCQAAGIQPHVNERTGETFLGMREIDRLRQVKDLPAAPSASPASVPATGGSTDVTSTRNGYVSTPAKPTSGAMSRTELSVIVDAVSNAKEGILRDLSQLLDDKLSGLDEVVVELIRSKTENDKLREELKRLQDSKALVQAEIDKFKPAAFGFYRKEN